MPSRGSRATTTASPSSFMDESPSTFHEWKTVNKVWSPTKASTSATCQELYWNNTSSTLTDKGGYGFSVTPMERAMTASPFAKKKTKSNNHLPSVQYSASPS
ncbi:Aste57867_6555 [Aphanomyces stellatus]|uniref:Aste57867_6555 protein n=1 Tax=Aphanomyces stellatus TaxID=120398 RepID=A0A485KFK3_9STRA|nr:hypothetical protein As57867_006538 [Aphanomyces stellatus]VFT83537.1 Aste57867_6555 [Aphanomyces stellatus]